MRRPTILLSAACLLLTGPPRSAVAGWHRDAAGTCVRTWSGEDVGRGPIAMVNAPLAPVRSAIGAARWELDDDQSPRGSTGRVLLVPVLGLLGGIAGFIDTGVWLFTGLADTVTGGYFAIAPDEATELSVAPMRPFFVPATAGAATRSPCDSR